MICQHCKKEGADYPRKPFHWDSGQTYILNNCLPFYFHKVCYPPWYESLVAGLANLDEVMNYCQYFERTVGNEGNYVREGKSYPVHGQWDGYHLNTKGQAGFKAFLEENNWLNNWFEIKEKYKKYL